MLTIRFHRKYTDIRGAVHNKDDVHALDDEAGKLALRDEMGEESDDDVTGEPVQALNPLKAPAKDDGESGKAPSGKKSGKAKAKK